MSRAEREVEVTRPRSPRLARALFLLLVRGSAAEHVLGDIEEEFHEEVLPRLGRQAARRWYWRNIVDSVRSIRRDRAPARRLHIVPASPEQIMDNTLRDIRFTFRSWLRQPAVTVIALAALALGIGANSAIFSVVYAVLLNPLSYPEPAQLTAVWLDNRQQGWPEDVTSYPNYVDWRERNSSFADMAAISFRSDNVTGSGDPERIVSAVVSPTFFDVLAVGPLTGRAFSDEDWDAEQRLVVLSYGLWQERFGGSTNALGDSIVINGDPHTVVGVMPRGFEYLRETVRYWRLFPGDVRESSRGQLWLQVVGRLLPGVSVAQAQADMDGVARWMEEEYPRFYANYGVNLVPLMDQVVGDVRPALLVLLGAVGLVLLISCANVANLMLARASARGREMVVRAAIGASRTRLLFQLLTESVLLAIVGGAAGLGLAFWGVRLLRGLEPDLPRLAEIGLNPPVLAFTLCVSVLTGLLFGVVPAAHAASTDLASSLKERAGSATRSGQRVRSALLVAELALALVLLVGAGLLIRSYQTLLDTAPGFEAGGLLSFRVSLSGPQYETGDDARAYFSQVLDRLRAVPGVSSAEGVRSLPLSGSISSGFFTVEGRPPVDRDQLKEVRMNTVTPGYFTTMGTELLAGRLPSDSDGPDDETVLLINEAMARTHFPGEDPVGRRFLYGIPEFYASEEDPDPELPWARIVGVVGSVRQNSLEETPEPEIFAIHDQNPVGTLYFVLRTERDPAAIAAAARGAVWEVDSNLPVADLQTMRGRLGRTTSARRFNLTMLALFAGVAAVLAAIGIYGVVSYSVAQRTRDIGLRMALGARRGDVLRLMLRQTLVVVLLGVGVGIIASLALTRLMTSLLYGVGTSDPVTFVAVALLLSTVAVVATLVPARRATHIDPADALRNE